MSRRRIAIACQGGGSQCAFVAGALKTLLSPEVQDQYRVVGLSGTSGGALTAALAWSGMLKQAQGDSTPIADGILGLWRDLTAQTPLEIFLDSSCVQLMRLTEGGVLPSFARSPASPYFEFWSKLTASMIGRPEFTDLRAVVTKHLDFGALPRLVEPDSPVLLVAAANVLEGTFRIFSSVRGEVHVDSLLASAAIPNLFPAAWVDGQPYWDGIFSSNPPVTAFLRKAHMGQQALPEEIWIIQVNPTRTSEVPERSSDVTSRRNQMAGNLSLQHELELIALLNVVLQEGGLSETFRSQVQLDTTEPIKVRFIRMSEALLDRLDYVSKLSRQPALIATLIADGEAQAQTFLAELENGAHPITHDAAAGVPTELH